MILRDYQVKAEIDIRQCYREGARRVVLQSGTGSGKTVIASSIIEQSVSRGNQVAFLAAKRELVTQAYKKMLVPASIIMAGDQRFDPSAKCQVASIQTLLSRGFTFKPTFIVLDECHHSTAKSHQDLLAAYPDTPILGLSATPIRNSGKGLGDYFQSMVKGPSIPWLISEGHLLQPRHYLGPAPTQPRDKLIGDPVKAWMEICPGVPTMAFASTVEESVKLVARFNAETPYRFEHIDADTPDAIRDTVADRLASGELTGVSGFAIYLEGFDAPAIQCVIMDRAFGSLANYLQAAGRGLRPHVGQFVAYILDHGNNLREWGRIDQDREWVLTSGRDVITGPSTPDVADNLLVCPKCFILAPQAATHCACGYKFSIKPRKTYRHKAGTLELHHDDGRVTEIGEDKQRKDYERFLWQQRNGRKKDGSPFSPKYAFFRFFQQYGKHPKREWG